MEGTKPAPELEYFYNYSNKNYDIIKSKILDNINIPSPNYLLEIEKQMPKLCNDNISIYGDTLNNIKRCKINVDKISTKDDYVDTTRYYMGGILKERDKIMNDDFDYIKIPYDLQSQNEYTLKVLGQPIFEKENKNKKEGKNMNNVLNIYRENQLEKINNETRKESEKIRKESEIGKIVDKLQKQAEKELEKIALDCKEKTIETIKIFYSDTKEIKDAIDKAYEERNEKEQKLSDTLKEVEALLDNCETYEQKMDILEAYNIVDKDWKIVK
jgi:hypothetical protein